MILFNRPEFFLALTLGFWLLSSQIYKRLTWPIFHPVPLCILFIITTLSILGIDFKTYYAGTLWLHWLLGPATVAMAFPLYKQRKTILEFKYTILFGTILSTVFSLLVVYFLGRLGGLSELILKASMTKSITTPIALVSAKDFGADPSLAVLMVVITGILGATMASYILDFLRIEDARVRGFAVGFSAHGLGTAVAYQKCKIKGAWASLGMILNGIFTPLILFPLWEILEKYTR